MIPKFLLTAFLISTTTAFPFSLSKRMSYHSNSVLFNAINQPADDSVGLISGTFTISQLSITPGQDPDSKNQPGYITSGVQLPEALQFTFNVGRKGSTNVANFWNNWVPPSQNTFDHTADKLNFAFLGTLTLNYQRPQSASGIPAQIISGTFQNIGLAQGHSGGSNNWWFGGATGSGATYVGEGAPAALLQAPNDNAITATGVDQYGRPTTWTFVRGDTKYQIKSEGVTNPVETVFVSQIVYQQVVANVNGTTLTTTQTLIPPN